LILELSRVKSKPGLTLVSKFLHLHQDTACAISTFATLHWRRS